MHSKTRAVPRPSERGRTLLELLVVAALLLVAAAISTPYLRAYAVEAHLVGAARVFKGRFREARSIATRTGVYTAIRFEQDGAVWRYSIYADGDEDGVQAADIAAGRDRRIAGPFPLDAGSNDVAVAINPGTPAPPPDSGTLSGHPIKFGPSRMVSFSPLGGATPGTFYLAGVGRQAAVRVNGGTGRVRVMVCRGRKWVETP
jgi:Tfp pilus assembly major pilin PilA